MDGNRSLQSATEDCTEASPYETAPPTREGCADSVFVLFHGVKTDLTVESDLDCKCRRTG